MIMQQEKIICVFGLGKTGLSAARYLQRIGQPFFVVDTRQAPDGTDELLAMDCCKQVYLGDIEQDTLNIAEKIILSPGVDPRISWIKNAVEAGVEIVGDIELFARSSSAKIIAITGSNGKSTVTDLTFQLLKAAGKEAAIGGNFGKPVLDYLPQDEAEIYVLELSSFQLDSTSSLNAEVATILNITEDHMDRYGNFDEYASSKLSIYEGARSKLVNLDDPLTIPKSEKDFVGFSLENQECKYHLDKNDFLVCENTKIINVNELNVTGRHNWANALASLAILNELNIAITPEIITALKSYRGLKHRFELIKRTPKVDWINDSKATNVGSTEAALNSIDRDFYQCVVLIAGGVAKGADLSPLRKPLKMKVDHVLALGKDRELIADLVSADIVTFVDSMRLAVEKAQGYISANCGDDKKGLVLLSPACASLDMYPNFEARGEEFVNAVEASQ
ncbi:UDP-N-acetylmuramoyl-L-alanine--D-glutamate ligase [Aliikangiella sp. G2MR2-5]|uniref:UDP-N-acetylmuramoyl-L-alanine--D-glutamate ligase n=1 Tax=Aliikangiella sp. G2MR2-5 TaxID=2788943 RepID=UPI0018A88C44|nr:UDP-N-acetylmuramoyl-L-alanine--D-glutamate ligase [Aliikangiella sp. G2MR2-5]